MWYKRNEVFFPVASPFHNPHNLNSSQVALCGPRRSSAVLIPELHAANGSISYSCEEENCPDTRDDGANGKDQDVETGHDKWGVGGDNKCLDG